MIVSLLAAAALLASGLKMFPVVENPAGRWAEIEGVFASITYFRDRNDHLSGDDTLRIVIGNFRQEPTEVVVSCGLFKDSDLVSPFPGDEQQHHLLPGQVQEIEFRSPEILEASSAWCDLVVGDLSETFLEGEERPEGSVTEHLNLPDDSVPFSNLSETP